MTNTCVPNTSGTILLTVYTPQRTADVSMSRQVVLLDIVVCCRFEIAQSRAVHPTLTVEHALSSTSFAC